MSDEELSIILNDSSVQESLEMLHKSDEHRFIFLLAKITYTLDEHELDPFSLHTLINSFDTLIPLVNSNKSYELGLVLFVNNKFTHIVEYFIDYMKKNQFDTHVEQTVDLILFKCCEIYGVDFNQDAMKKLYLSLIDLRTSDFLAIRKRRVKGIQKIIVSTIHKLEFNIEMLEILKHRLDNEENMNEIGNLLNDLMSFTNKWTPVMDRDMNMEKILKSIIENKQYTKHQSLKVIRSNYIRVYRNLTSTVVQNSDLEAYDITQENYNKDLQNANKDVEHFVKQILTNDLVLMSNEKKSKRSVIKKLFKRSKVDHPQHKQKWYSWRSKKSG